MTAAPTSTRSHTNGKNKPPLSYCADQYAGKGAEGWTAGITMVHSGPSVTVQVSQQHVITPSHPHPGTCLPLVAKDDGVPKPSRWIRRLPGHDCKLIAGVWKALPCVPPLPAHAFTQRNAALAPPPALPHDPPPEEPLSSK
jgi:hypothetical protein